MCRISPGKESLPRLPPIAQAGSIWERRGSSPTLACLCREVKAACHKLLILHCLPLNNILLLLRPHVTHGSHLPFTGRPPITSIKIIISACCVVLGKGKRKERFSDGCRSSRVAEILKTKDHSDTRYKERDRGIQREGNHSHLFGDSNGIASSRMASTVLQTDSIKVSELLPEESGWENCLGDGKHATCRRRHLAAVVLVGTRSNLAASRHRAREASSI